MSRDRQQSGDGSQAAEHRVTRATSEGVDAQNATEFDMRNGIAGAEAKPFSKDSRETPASPEVPAEPDEPADEQHGLISGRRNAGREDGAVDKRNV